MRTVRTVASVLSAILARVRAPGAAFDAMRRSCGCCYFRWLSSARVDAIPVPMRTKTHLTDWLCLHTHRPLRTSGRTWRRRSSGRPSASCWRASSSPRPRSVLGETAFLPVFTELPSCFLTSACPWLGCACVLLACLLGENAYALAWRFTAQSRSSSRYRSLQVLASATAQGLAVVETKTAAGACDASCD